MIYLSILGIVAVIFLAQLRNEVGAVMMGLAAGGVDFFLQWLRVKLVAANSKYIGLVVLSGLVIRAASVFMFIKISTWWFGFNNFNFYLFAGCLLALLPVLSLVAAYKFKPQRD